MDYPKVSVITPSYNQGQFIEDTILSVKNQDYPNIEHIIIDGGSTDNTLEILKKYSNSIIWISEPDKGQSNAINKGWRMATGDIVSYLNSDDTYTFGAISKAVAYLMSNPEIGMVYGDYNRIDEKGKLICTIRDLEFDYRIFFYAGLIMQPTAFIRKSVLESIGMMDESLKYCMDFDLFIRIAQKFPIVHIPEILANFRWHNQSKTYLQKRNLLKERISVRRRYHKFSHKHEFFASFCFLILEKYYTLKRAGLKLMQGRFKKIAPPCISQQFICRDQIDILMVGPSFEQKIIGGISAVVKTLLNSSLCNKYKILYVSTTPLIGNKIEKCFFFVKGLSIFIIALLVKKPKIIHIHTSSRFSFFRKSFFFLISKILGKRVILHIHSGEFHLFYSERGKLQSRFIRKVLDSADKIVVLTEQWLKNIKKMTSNENISILYNPVNCAVFNINRNGKYHNHNKEKIVLFAGELCRKKGIYTIIQAIPSILTKYKKVKFILAGKGEIEKVKKICKEMGIQNNVCLHGFVAGEKKIKVFAEADIYILPSYNEGLPVSVLEAMASGLPIITTPVGGIPEAVKNGINGFLIEPGNSEMLADKILKLLKDDELRKNMGRKSLKIVKEKFDINIIDEQLSNIYEEFLSN